MQQDVFDCFVPPQARLDARLAERAKAVARSLLTISVVVSLLLLVFLLVRSRPSSIELALFAAAAVTPALAAVAIRFSPSPLGVLLLTNIAGIAYVGIWAYVTGGVLSVALPWLIALLATLGTFGNPRVLLGTFATGALVLAALYTVTVKGLLPPSLVPAEEAALLAFIAHAMSGYRELCLQAGMDDYLAKPYQVEALDDVLQRWLTARA